MFRARSLCVSLALIALAACKDAQRDLVDPNPPKPDAALGQVSFEQSCSGCHASRDGFDLKTFGFTDTTIIRRAVKHVDTATARNIVAYIHTLQAPPKLERTRLFQPRETPLVTDVDFAMSLFGRDAWPEDMTTAQLTAINPRNVAVSVTLPIWSDEQTNMDWMPDNPLPQGILDYLGSSAAGAIAGYRAAPTIENLTRAVNAIKTADRATANVAAPCLLEDTVRARYTECFDTRRWAATLVALHMMRNGIDATLSGNLQDIWWDVGNTARQSTRFGHSPVANATTNWAAWMFLGFMFDPSLHSSSYLGGGLKALGFNRQATFVAMRSLVARPKGSLSVYEDLVNAERFAPTSWATAVTIVALRAINDRIASGDSPNASQVASAQSSVNTALTEVYKKVSATDRTRIDAAAAPVLAALKTQ